MERKQEIELMISNLQTRIKWKFDEIAYIDHNTDRFEKCFKEAEENVKNVRNLIEERKQLK